MSFIDRIAAAITPAASDEDCRKARRAAQERVASDPWIAAILDHHQRIERLITEAINANAPADRRWALREVAQEITAHAMAEEAIIYPDIAEYDSKAHAGFAYEEHAMTKIQLAILEKMDPSTTDWQEKLRHIEGALRQHMYQEEGSWLPELSEKLPAAEKSRIAKRYLEEYHRYMGGEGPCAEEHIPAVAPLGLSETDLSMQAMPNDGRPGAPDGVNTQGALNATDGSDIGSAYPNPHTGKSDAERADFGTFLGHGGQSTIGYHGSGRLGEQKLKPGGNINSGTKGD